MDQLTLLQIFLILDALLIGIFIPIAIRHAYEHFKKPKENIVKHSTVSPQPIRLSPEAREKLIQRTQANLQAIMDRAASEFEHNLTEVSNNLNRNFEKIASGIIVNETKRYQLTIANLIKQVEENSKNANTEFENNQASIGTELKNTEEKLETQLRAKIKEKQDKLIQDIDTKLADAVASFLTDTLQHNVDLGAQNEYLLATLEEHKEDLKGSVSDDI